MRLARSADVVVENFKAEVKHGLRWTTNPSRRSTRPSSTPASPDSARTALTENGPGVDQIIQGMSGLMSITGEPGSGPWRVGIAISDTSAGMFLGQGILLALLHRERTGEGQWVHTSLLEAMLCKLDFQGARYTMGGEVPEQQGNDHPYQTPMGAFLASDGLVNIAAPSQRLWVRFCRALGADELFNRPEYRRAGERKRLKAALNADINAVTARFTTAELVRKLNNAGCLAAPSTTSAKPLRTSRCATWGWRSLRSTRNWAR